MVYYHDEFARQIKSGVAGPEVFEEGIAKFKASGIDVIIAAYQEQLDAYLATK